MRGPSYSLEDHSPSEKLGDGRGRGKRSSNFSSVLLGHCWHLGNKDVSFLRLRAMHKYFVINSSP